MEERSLDKELEQLLADLRGLENRFPSLALRGEWSPLCDKGLATSSGP